MKKIIVFISMFFSLTASGQNNAVEDTTAKPIITAIGKPDGEKTEMTIGKEGGSFTSSDGKMRLLVPEGAVSKKTKFSIHPITNTMPGGNGKAYHLEPSGVNFQKALQVIFPYAYIETEGNSPELLGIARQDDSGQWSSLNKTSRDTVAKIMRAETSHFSRVIMYSIAYIDPESARVKVNGSLRLRVIKVLNVTTGNNNSEVNPLLLEPGYLSSELWRVNNVPRGNPNVGLISASEDVTAIYQAPAKVPSQNPVAVTVQDNHFDPRRGQYNDIKLVSNITIYDGGYEVKMVALLKDGSADAWGGIVTYKDEGSFLVSLENNEPAVINIINKLEVVTYSTCPNRIITNPTTCTGVLHVAGIKQIKVTPANPPGQPHPIVEIWFMQYPTELTRFTFDCPPPPGAPKNSKGKADFVTPLPGATSGMLMMFGMPALPPYIKFIAKDEEQIIMEKGSPGSPIYYKFSVRKLD